MNDLVFLKRNQPVTTSLIIAERTENQHKSVIQLIDDHKTHFERWGQIYFSDLKTTNKFIGNPNDNKQSLSRDNRGRPTKVAFLNEPQATFLITLLRNNDVVLNFKEKLVDEFYQMRAILLNQQNAHWQELRGATKESCKELNAVIHELYLFAVTNGCKASEDKFFMNFYRLMNKVMGIDPKSRDKLPLWKLFDIDRLQYIARTVIKGLLAKGEDYHLPYQKCKAAFESYARVAFIPQRLLEG